jgi:VanZ family protein
MKYISLMISILLTTIVFSFSAATGEESASLSLTVAQTISDLLLRLFPSMTIDFDMLHLLIRKLAHMGEYGLIGISYAFTFHLFGWNPWFLLVAGLVLALADEASQLFSVGRGPSILDALLFDFPGFFLGASMTRWGIEKRIRKLNVS